MASSEVIETFPCFGAEARVIVTAVRTERAASAAASAKRRLLEWHAQFSRFEPGSELSRLNADPRVRVPVSAVMARLIEAALTAARESGGLVDPTLAPEIEAAGYADHFGGEPLELARALGFAPPRAPARPSGRARWREVGLDGDVVVRPVGLRFDCGGIAKGLFGDLLAADLEAHESYAIDCAGDVRVGGRAGVERPVQVVSPFAQEILHVFSRRSGAFATSGIGRRSWIAPDGRPAHHLLDPASGRPAYTGIVQVTAIAPHGVEAEWRAKAALLSGPAAAPRWLAHGGLIVGEAGDVELVAEDG